MKIQASRFLLLFSLFFCTTVQAWETYNTDDGYLTIQAIRNEIKAYLLNNSYSPRQVTTHPWITTRALKYIEDTDSSWNVLTPDEKTMIASGSVEEDFDMVRSSDNNHPEYTHISEGSTLGLFYPVNGSSINVEAGFDRAYNHYYTGGYDNNNLDSTVGRLDHNFIGPLDRTNAIYWALNSTINYRNLRYIRDNPSLSRIQKLHILGNLIHLLEDMASPPHPNGDPHPLQHSEETALNKISFTDHENFGGSVSIPDNLPSYLTLPVGAEYWEYFEKLSKFTREYFFSEDRMFMDWHVRTLRDGLGARDEKIINYKYPYFENGFRGYYIYTSMGRKLARYNHLLGYTALLSGDHVLASTWDEAKIFQLYIDEYVSKDSWRELWPITVKYVARFTKDFYTKEILSTPPPAPSNNYWAKTYDTFTDLFPKDVDIKQTIDNGFILSTVIDIVVPQDRDIVVAKLRNDGSLDWAKTYGSPGIEENHSIIPTKDGGYILAGYTTSYGIGIYDIWVLKLNQDGSIAWQKTYGGLTNSEKETNPHIFQNADGSYLLVANNSLPSIYSSYHIDVMKLDGNGSVLWQKRYGSENEQTYVDSAYLTNDGGCILTGFYQNNPLSSTPSNPMVMKINQDGSIAWTNIYKSNLLGGNLFSVAPASDGGYVVSGTSYLLPGSISSEWKMLIMKLTSTGSIVWNKIYYVDKNEIGLQQYANAINQISDGGYIVSGMGGPIDNVNTGLLLFKLDGNGAVMWAKNYSNYAMWSYTISQTIDGGFITAGMEGTCTWVLKIPPDGNIIFNSTTNAKLLNPAMHISIGDFINENISVSVTNASIITNNSNAIPQNINLIINTQSP